MDSSNAVPVPPAPPVPPKPPVAPSNPGGVDAGRVVADLGHLLVQSELMPEWSQVDPIALVQQWEQLPPSTSAPRDLSLHTIQSICAAVLRSREALLEGAAVGTKDETALRKLLLRLVALDATLARTDAGTVVESTPFICSQLNSATDALVDYVASQLLRSPQASLAPDASRLRAQALSLPALLLVRCTGVSAFTARELLSLAGGDLAVAVAVAVETGRAATGARGGGQCSNGLEMTQLPVRLWQALYHLSTPQGTAEILGQAGDRSSNDASMEDLLAGHIAHAHRLALSFAQFDALRAMCEWCADETQRGAILVMCLRTIQNLTASPHLIGAGRILARQLAVLWPRFGFKLLAPHLRRLLSAVDAGGRSADQAARELRRDLRTLGWLLHHSPELRQYARPLCEEIAMKALNAGHPPETLAVAVGTAANAAALDDRGALYVALDSVDESLKAQVREQLPMETNRLWVITEAWDVVEDLGFWPKEPATETGPSMRQDVAADLAAIAKLQPSAGASFGGVSLGGFDFLDPGGFEAAPWEPYETWDEADDEWNDWPELEEEGDDCDGAEFASALGPLGLPDVEPPPEPAPVACTSFPRQVAPMRLLCMAPEAFRCAIDGRLCVSPVRTPNGVLYEQSSIIAWLAWNKVCPVQGVPLAGGDLVEDVAIAESILQWLAYAEGGC